MNELKNFSEKKKMGIPILAKTETELVWPQNQVFYILAGNGLYRCLDYYTTTMA